MRSGPEFTMLKIEWISGKGGTRICLSGQLRFEHLSQVKSEVERAGQPVVLDLDEGMDAAGAKSTKIGPRKVNGISLAKQA
jgi:hypothetical protein